MNRKHRFPEQIRARVRKAETTANPKAGEGKNLSHALVSEYGPLVGIILLVVIGFYCSGEFSGLSRDTHDQFRPTSQLETQTLADEKKNAGSPTAILQNEANGQPAWADQVLGRPTLLLRNEANGRQSLADKVLATPRLKLRNEAKHRKNRDNPLHYNGLGQPVRRSKYAPLCTTVTEIRSIGSPAETGTTSPVAHTCVWRIPQTQLQPEAINARQPPASYNLVDRLLFDDAFFSKTGPRPPCVAVSLARNRPNHLPGSV